MQASLFYTRGTRPVSGTCSVNLTPNMCLVNSNLAIATINRREISILQHCISLFFHLGFASTSLRAVEANYKGSARAYQMAKNFCSTLEKRSPKNTHSFEALQSKYVPVLIRSIILTSVSNDAWVQTSNGLESLIHAGTPYVWKYAEELTCKSNPKYGCS